ncbi:50S ribosomal protein L32 [Patescibacteria group bacterium]|jgi:ribosomal protein L32|nr:50S ribosomal protein L32 [Patescibacteria group bacterium]
MALPGHRRTSSHKRRRASHFALKPAILSTDKATGLTHLSHRAAPGALEYNGKAIHVKGRDRKVAKLLAKSRAKADKAHADHDHDHAGHDHAHDQQ